MNAEVVLQSSHWKVWAVEDQAHGLHLMMTLLADEAGRRAGELLEDELHDLTAVIRDQVRRRGLSAYDTLAHVLPDQGVQVHLIADGPEASAQPLSCAGLAATVDTGDVRFVLDLAQAVQCPLCGHSVARWQIDQGRMRHEPGE